MNKLLRRHVELFNAGVRSGDFSAMVKQFADDAELVFDGMPVGPFRTRQAIGAAYRERPPDDEIEVFDVSERDGEIVADYAWRRQPSVRAQESAMSLGRLYVKVRDVKELDVQPVRRESRQLRDPVLLLEAEHELIAGVVCLLELLEPEEERRGLLAGDDQQSALDVVGAPEVVTLVERELPILAGGDPGLDRLDENARVLVDLDLDRLVGTLLGRRARKYLQRCHDPAFPAREARQT